MNIQREKERKEEEDEIERTGYRKRESHKNSLCYYFIRITVFPFTVKGLSLRFAVIKVSS